MQNNIIIAICILLVTIVGLQSHSLNDLKKENAITKITTDKK
jgi:hypothetical protein